MSVGSYISPIWTRRPKTTCCSLAGLQTKSSSSHPNLTQTVAHCLEMKSPCVGARGCRLCSYCMDTTTLTSRKNRGRTADGLLLFFSNHFISWFIHLSFIRHLKKKKVFFYKVFREDIWKKGDISGLIRLLFVESFEARLQRYADP